MVLTFELIQISQWSESEAKYTRGMTMGRRTKPPKSKVDFVPRAKSIAELAHALNMIVGSTSNILIVFEQLRKIFPKLRMKVVSDDLLPGLEARAYPKQWLIKIRKGMNEGLRRGDARARWTLAHEIAHVILQHPKTALARKRDVDSGTLLEREADLFVATFLAPYNENARQCRTPEEIKELFNISIGAAERRYKEFQLERLQHHLNKTNGLEHQFGIICRALLATINKMQTREDLVEPFKGNVVGAAMLTTLGSRLLVDAYRKFRQLSDLSHSQKAAVLATTILTMQPIQSMYLNGSASYHAISCNRQFALRAAEYALGLTDGYLDEVELPQPVLGESLTFESSYLRGLVREGAKLASKTTSLRTLTNLISLKSYNEQNCLYHSDIRDIEYLAVQIEALLLSPQRSKARH